MKKKHLKEIERINKSIPKELLNKLIVLDYKFPTIRDIVIKAMKNPDEVEHIVSKEQLEKYKAMLLSGYLDQKHEMTNPEIEKQINDYLDAEFEKARKLGRLPPPQKMPILKNKAKKLYVHDTKAENPKEENK